MDFRITGKDSGLSNPASIQPVLNGEDANQTTFQRPSENLRTRTEVIRKAMDHAWAEMQADRGLCIMSASDAKLCNNGAGKFSLNYTGTYGASDRHLIIAPIASMYDETTPPGSSIRAKYFYSMNVGADQFRTQVLNTIFASNGGNNLYIKIYKNGRNSTAIPDPVVTIEGDDGGGTYPADGPVVICVEIATDNVHTLDDVVAQLKLAPATTYLDATETTVVAGGTNAVEEVAEQPFYQEAGGMAAVDAECYKITAGNIDDYFTTYGGLVDGEALVLKFPTPEDRRGCTASTSLAAMLQVISDDSRTMAGGNVVPICKRIGTRLVFLNGKIIEGGASDYIVLGSAALDGFRSALASQVTSTSGDYLVGGDLKNQGVVHTAFNLAAGTLNAQLRAITEMISKQATDAGDTWVGANVKNAASGATFSLVQGTVKTQLQSIIDQLAVNSSSTPGSARVGADSVTSSPQSLSLGTVNDQLSALLGFYNGHAGAGTTDKHTDAVVTALIKETPGGPTNETFTLLAGDVHSQLQSVINQLSEKAPDGGAAHVGAKITATGGAHDYAPGSVESQLGAMLGWYNSHVTGSDPHTFKTVSNRPFVTCGSSSTYNDYTSLETAVSALKTSGGTILVTSALTTNIDIDNIGANITAGIRVLGMSRGMTVTVTAAKNFFNATGTRVRAPITFVNLKILAAQDKAIVNYTETETAFPNNGSLIFQQCEFIAANGEAPTTAAFVQHDNAMYFDDCAFTNYGFTYTHTEPIFECTPTANEKGILRVTNCTFEECGTLASLPSTTLGWAEFVMRGCLWHDCGYSANASNIPYLISSGVQTTTAGIQHFDVSQNVQIKTSVNAHVTSFICKLYGNGTFDGNRLREGLDYSVTDSANAMVILYGSGTTTLAPRVWARGNQLRLNGACRGIVINNGVADGNAIYDFQNVEVGASNRGIVVNGGRVVNNRIQDANSDLTTFAGIHSTGSMEGDVISGNYVTFACDDTYVYGILSAGANASISDNYIDGPGTSGDSQGITVTGLSTIKGNHIQHTLVAIALAAGSSRSVVSDNTIQGSVTTAKGIDIDSSISLARVSGNTIYYVKFGVICAAVNCVIRGNSVSLAAVADAIGIEAMINAARCVISDNHVLGDIGYAQTGIYIATGYDIVTGNHLSSVKFGITANGSSVKYFVIANNMLHIADVAGSVGIDISHASTVFESNGALTGNVVMRMGKVTRTSSIGINYTYVIYCSISGNHVGPFEETPLADNYFPDPFEGANAGGTGLGKNLGMTDNVDTYNMYSEA